MIRLQVDNSTFFKCDYDKMREKIYLYKNDILDWKYTECVISNEHIKALMNKCIPKSRVNSKKNR